MALPHYTGTTILAHDGIRYSVCAFARQREDGLWMGWTELTAVNGQSGTWKGPETVQATCEAVEGWAAELDLDQLRSCVDQTAQGADSDDSPALPAGGSQRFRSGVLLLNCR